MSADSRFSIRPLSAEDSEFISHVAPRLYHGPTASPRDAEKFQG
jgi:hypothetical protein